MGDHLLVQRVQRAPGGLLARGDRVVAVHQDLGLDDRHDVGLLAQGRVARHRVGVRVDREIGRGALADDDRRAPLREARAELAVLGESLAQPVQALGDGLAGEQRERLRAGVDLDPGDRAGGLEDLHEGDAVVRRLPDRLVEQDHAADVLAEARRS